MIRTNQVVRDNGSNRLYDSWEIIDLYDLYDEEVEVGPEGNRYHTEEIAPWEGRKIKFSVENY